MGMPQKESDHSHEVRRPTPSSQRPMLGCAMVSFYVAFRGLKMDLSDRIFMANHDWDPNYLKYIFTQDFYEFRELWQSNVCDTELLQAEWYSPIARIFHWMMTLFTRLWQK